MTRVLPEPAPARIKSGPSPCSTASFCGGLRWESRFVVINSRDNGFVRYRLDGCSGMVRTVLSGLLIRESLPPETGKFNIDGDWFVPAMIIHDCAPCDAKRICRSTQREPVACHPFIEFGYRESEPGLFFAQSVESIRVNAYFTLGPLYPVPPLFDHGSSKECRHLQFSIAGRV